jgi:hypothetical protein
MLAVTKKAQSGAQALHVKLLAGCAVAAAMLSGGFSRNALAQSIPPVVGPETAAFQGIPTIASGNATIVQTATIDTITIGSPNAVINFTPFDTATGGGPITFLPNGRTGLFQSDGKITNFTVLNRIIPTDATRAIKLDGTVLSRLASGANGAVAGGTILFYSPGGIIAGPNALFDVGSLVLSAADVAFTGNTINFSNAALGSAINVNAGAQILAQGTGSYVALVAPQIIQSGTVKSDGSVAYIAAQSVDVTIQNNLFDIHFVQGTGSAAAVDHDGTTELTRVAGDASQQRVYVAAVPKNDAITALVSGNIGYSAATAVELRDGQIILSAGRSIADNNSGLSFSDVAGATAPASIKIGADTTINSLFSAPVTTNATGDALIAPADGTTVTFNNAVNLNADRLAEVRAGAGSSVIVNSNLFVSSNNLVNSAAARVIATGNAGYGGTGYGAGYGTIFVSGDLTIDGGPTLSGGMARLANAELVADLGRITVNGDTRLIANSLVTEGPVDALAGNATVTVGGEGSQLSLDKLTLSARATGIAGTAGYGNDLSGNATGGTTTISVSGGMLTAFDISVDNSATASGRGLAQGGTALVNVGSGTLSANTLFVDGTARVIAAPMNTDPVAAPFPSKPAINGPATNNMTAFGDARGGATTINLEDGSFQAASLTVDVSAFGGNGQGSENSGNGFGGTGRLSISGGDASIATIDVLADGNGGRGGNVFEGLGSRGGNGMGGTSEINLTGGTVTTAGFNLSAVGIGGDGGNGTEGGTGGTATGGAARFNSNGNGSPFFTLFGDGDSPPTALGSVVDASARGGAGGVTFGVGVAGAGGAATGGQATLSLAGAEIATTSDPFAVDFIVTADAAGGSGGNSNAQILATGNGGSGGAAVGGTATTSLQSNLIDVGNLMVSGSATGGAGGSGSAGYGSVAIGGAGGNASAGSALVSIDSARVTIDLPAIINNASIVADSRGGAGGVGAVGGAGGDALGTGLTSFVAMVGDTVVTDAFLSASSVGGAGGNGLAGNGGNGGDSLGGIARIIADGATANLTINNSAAVAVATSGAGGNAQSSQSGATGGDAGIATGGTAQISAENGSTVRLTLAAIANARSFGGLGGNSNNGSGGAGGAAIGGGTRIDGNVGALTALNLTSVSGGFGGAGGNAGYGSLSNGGVGGLATGGTATINNADFSSQNSNAFVGAFAVGGIGGSGQAGGNGGAGGAATGGTARVSGRGDLLTATNLTVTAGVIAGAGGNAGYGGLGNGGAGGAGTGGAAIVTNARFNSQNSVVFIGTNAGGGNGGAGQIGGEGGAAIAGTTSFVATNITNVIGTLDVAASTAGGMGGAQIAAAPGGRGGNGGTGQGGDAQIVISGGAFNASSAVIRSTAGGGAGGFGETGGNGGLATGGTAMLSSTSGAAMQIGSLNVTVGAGGGSGGQASILGGNGGNAQAGTAGVRISGGTFQASDIMVRSAATGGTSDLSGNGGSALAGAARLIGSNGSTLMLANVSVVADATSNSFVTQVDAQPTANTVASATNGHASGGVAELALSSGSSLVGGTITMSANATIGRGRSQVGATGAVANNGAADGMATGGTTSVAVEEATVALTQALNLSANAIGDASGLGQGGMINVTAAGGSITTPSINASANGRGFVPTQGVNPSLGGRGGTVNILAQTNATNAFGALNLGSAQLSASGTNSGYGGDVPGGKSGIVQITNANGNAAAPAVNFTNLNASTLGNDPAGFGSQGIVFKALGSTINAGSTTLTSGANIAVNANGLGQVIGTSFQGSAANGIMIAHVGQPGTVDTLRATTINLTAGQAYNASAGSIVRATGDATISFGANSVLGTIVTGGALIASGTGDGSYTKLTSGGATTLNVTGALSGIDAIASGVFMATADNTNLTNVTSLASDIIVNARAIGATNATAARDVIAETRGAANSSITLATAAATRDVRLTGGTNGVTATALTAGNDIDVATPGNATITSGNAGRNLRNTSANLSATTLTAGTDVVILTDAAASLGTTTAGARIVVNAGSSIDFTQLMSGTTTSLVAGTSITGGNADARTTLSLNANGGTVGFGMLSSGANTTITSSSAITGNSANASGALTLNSGANGITATTLTSGTNNNLTVTASNGGTATITAASSGLDLSVNATNVSVATGAAARDIVYSAAANIDAGQTMAGRNIRFNAGGNIVSGTATAANDFAANSVGNTQMATTTADNIFVVATGNATLGNATARTMIGVKATNIDGTTLSAGEDVRLISTGTATVSSVTAGDDLDISATEAISLGTATVTGTARDDRSLSFAAPQFSIVAATGDGSDVRLTSAGNISAANLAAGDDIIVSGGNFNLTGLAKTRGVGAVGTGSDVVVSGSAVTLANVEAFNNLNVSATTFAATSLLAGNMIDVVTTGNQSLGTARAVLGSINGIASNGAISFAQLTSGAAITLNATNGIIGGDANAGTSLALTGNAGAVNFGTLQSGTTTTITSVGAIAGANIFANGAVLISGDGAMVNRVTSNLDSVNASARLVDIGTASAGLDVIVDTKGLANSSITLGTATAARDISLTGGTNGITATSLTAGDDIDVTGAGTVTLANALTTGSFNTGYGNQGYGQLDPSNLTVTASTGSTAVTTGRARDNVTITARDGATATALTADRGAILVNGGTSANIMQSTATLGGVTINAGVINAATVTAGTNATLGFGASATLGQVTAAGAIAATGTGSLAYTSLTSGGTTTLMAGGSVIGADAVAGSTLSIMADSIDVDTLTSTRDTINASARLVDIGTASAGRDVIVDTKGLSNSSITLGTATAGRDISLTAGTTGGFPAPGAISSIVASSLTAGDDIDVLATNNVNIASALTTGSFNAGYGGADPSNLNITTSLLGNASLATGRAKDNLAISTGIGGANSAVSLTADRGNILVLGQMSANVSQATATLGSVTLNGAFVNAREILAGTDATVSFFIDGRLGTVIANRDVTINGAMGRATILQLAATLGSARINTGSVNATSISAGTDVNVDFSFDGMLGTVSAGRDIAINSLSPRSPNSTLIATSLIAGDDITVSTGGDATIVSAITTGNINAGYGGDPSNLSVISTNGALNLMSGRAKDNLTLMALTDVTSTALLLADRGDIIVNGQLSANIKESTSTLRSVTINSNAINATTVSAATNATFGFGTSATLGTVTAGNAITATGAGNLAYTRLTSGGTTNIMTGGSVTGANAVAGSTLSIMADSIDVDTLTSTRDTINASARLVDIGTATAGRDVIVDTKGLSNSSITLGTATAARDISLTGGTNGIVATSLTAGDDIGVDGAGNVTIANALTTGSFNTGYGAADPSNLTVTASLSATVTTGRARDNITIGASNGVAAAALTADRGVIVVNGGTSANIVQSTAMMGAVTINAGVINAANVNAATNATFGFGASATLGTVNAGNAITASGTGNLTYARLMSGGTTTIMTGGSVTGADAVAGARLSVSAANVDLTNLTSARDSIVINANLVNIRNAMAATDVVITAPTTISGTQMTLGSIIAGRDIRITGNLRATGAPANINATMLFAGDDIDVLGNGLVTIASAMTTGNFNQGNATDPSNITITLDSFGNRGQANIGLALARDNLFIRATDGVTATSLVGDRGVVVVTGGRFANIAQAVSNLSNISISADVLTIGEAMAGNMARFFFNENSTLGNIVAGGAINATGTGSANLSYMSLNSGTTTTLMAGGSVIGADAVAGSTLSIMADSIDVDTLTSTRDTINASARLVDIGTATAGLDVIVDTKGLSNSSITLGTATAARDISLTGGTNGITATSLTAGDDIDVTGAGTVTLANALTTGSFNTGYGNQGYGQLDPSNLTVTASTGSTAVTTGRARDNVTITARDGATATALTADRGAILVNGGTSANIMQSTATLGGVTINAGVINAATVTAGTNATLGFGASATLGQVTAAGAIAATGTGSLAYTSLTSGGTTTLMAGGSVIGADAVAGSTLSIMADSIDVDTLTSTRDTINASARLVDIGTASAGRDVIVDTKGLSNSSITLGTATAGRDISLTGGTNGISVFNLTAGDDIDIVGSGNILDPSARTSFIPNGTLTSGAGNTGYGETGYGGDPHNITISSPGSIALGRLISQDNITLTAVNGATITSADAARGNIVMNTGLSATPLLGANATNGSITINAGVINTPSLSAGSDITVNFGDRASIGNAFAGNAINVTGTGNLSLSRFTSGAATTLMAGGSITGGSSTAGGLLSIMSDSIDLDQATSRTNSVNASARIVDINTVDAGLDVNVDTKGLANSNITLFSTTAVGDINLTGATNEIDAFMLRAGDDLTIKAAGNLRISKALISDAISIDATPAGRISANALIADRGAITISGAGSTVLGTARATLGNVAVTGDRVEALRLDAGTGVAVNYGTFASTMTVNAGTTAQITGTGALGFDAITSGGATTLSSGAAISGRTATAGASFASTSGGTFTATGPIAAGRTANIVASGIRIADVTGGTGVSLRSGTTVATGNVTATTNDAVIVGTTGVTSGALSAANISIANISGDVLTGAASATNDITITNGGMVNLASASAGDDLRIIGQSGVTVGAITTGGGGDLDGDGNDVFIRTTGPINIMSATTRPTALATSDIILSSTAGSINAATLTSRGAVALNAVTAITVGSATSGANILLAGQSINATTLTAATDVDATATGAATIGTARATGGNLTLTAAGALSATNAGARGNVRLTSSSGSVNTGTLSSGSAFSGGTAGGNPGAGDIMINAGTTATMTGDSSAGRNLAVTARDLVTIGGVANGLTIDVRSGDIAINPTTGRIGEQGRTTQVQLTNSSANVTTIGGTGTTGYSLANAEAQRIFAGDIVISAARTVAGTTPVPTTLTTSAPDVVLDTLSLTAANGQTGATVGNIGTSGRLRIETPGKLRTVGAVSLTNLGTGNRFQVNAAQSIEVDAATGSISLANATSGLGGRLELTAPNVIAASLGAISDVIAAVDTKAASDRLALNDVAISDNGSLRADGIVVNVANGFFVQNTGSQPATAFNFGARRGITVGSGGLLINAANANTRVIISGRQLTASGGFLTGLDFLRQASLNGTQLTVSGTSPTGFAAGSTINGCAFLNPTSCMMVTIDAGSLARDVVGQAEDNQGGTSNSADGNFFQFQLKATEDTTFQPVVDDPVTGVGNDDLWALYDAKDCTDDPSACPQ